MSDTGAIDEVAVEEDMDIVKRINVLLVGGASHHVYYGPKVPEGALRREARRWRPDGVTPCEWYIASSTLQIVHVSSV